MYSSEVNPSYISLDFTTTVIFVDEFVTDDSKPRTYRICKDTVAMIQNHALTECVKILLQ